MPTLITLGGATARGFGQRLGAIQNRNPLTTANLSQDKGYGKYIL